MDSENNVVWFNGYVSREKREKLHGHKSRLIWITGLSASGKSTIAYKVEERLYKKGFSTFVFDGDNIRHGLCSDLGFKMKDRDENIRRISQVVKLFLEAGIIIICAFISPKVKQRQKVRELIGKENFLEIFIDCPIDICEKRDPKGIYKKARNGTIKDFTGIVSIYERPVSPDIRIDSDKEDIGFSVNKIINFIKERNFISL